MSLYFRKNKDIKVDLEVPSLPTFEDKKKDKKEKRKAERHLVSQPKHETPPPKDPEVYWSQIATIHNVYITISKLRYLLVDI